MSDDKSPNTSVRFDEFVRRQEAAMTEAERRALDAWRRYFRRRLDGEG